MPTYLRFHYSKRCLELKRKENNPYGIYNKGGTDNETTKTKHTRNSKGRNS